LTAAAIKDGLSQTVGMSERLIGGFNPQSFDRRRDFWFSGAYQSFGYAPPVDQMVQICDSLTSTSPPFHPYTGASWGFSYYHHTWYNHAVGPNSSTPDCDVMAPISSPAYVFSPPEVGGVFKASSFHPGGVVCLFMDGSVHFIANGIDLDIWRAIATRDGRETTDMSDVY
jgi:hypothetical protein